MTARARAGLGFALALGLWACGPKPSPTASAPWPEGTAFALDGRPIPRGEVEAIAGALAPLGPHWTQNELARQAITSLILPREALGSAMAEGRAQAWSRAQEELAARRLGSAHGTEAEVAHGGWGDLGLGLWSAARAAPEGVWSGPVEDPGQTAVFRRLPPALAAVETGPGLDAIRVQAVAVEVVRFPWAEPAPGRDGRPAGDGEPGEAPSSRAPPGLEAAYDRVRLTVVDPAYRDLIPMALRHRMGAP